MTAGLLSWGPPLFCPRKDKQQNTVMTSTIAPKNPVLLQNENNISRSDKHFKFETKIFVLLDRKHFLRWPPYTPSGLLQIVAVYIPNGVCG